MLTLPVELIDMILGMTDDISVIEPFKNFLSKKSIYKILGCDNIDIESGKGNLKHVKILNEILGVQCTKKALHNACNGGHSDVIKYLLTSKIKMKETTTQWVTLPDYSEQLISTITINQQIIPNKIDLLVIIKNNNLNILRYICGKFNIIFNSTAEYYARKYAGKEVISLVNHRTCDCTNNVYKDTLC